MSVEIFDSDVIVFIRQVIMCLTSHWPINVHYILSLLQQDIVSVRVCSLNQYHYESGKQIVVTRLVQATYKTCCKVMYQHIMSVVSLSNISIKMHFTQLTRVELPNVYTTSMGTTFCAWRHVICCDSFPNVTFLFKHCLSLLYNRPTTLFNLEKCGPDILNLGPWKC